ncbi:hypothetical protein [Sphingobacterium sp. GVS05A]|uniref:hypothetical protein n=1 Tax=Sphingobacterium sp. GVS05A TaxID=2862679 RepID=UPI001CC09930|nr:hypothetical protein [Sphingobacterium sp. GVS05A]
MSAKQLYGVDATVECFNILYDGYPSDKRALKKDYDQNLILFSVLPNVEGGLTWKEVAMDSIQKSIIPFGSLNRLFEAHTYSLFFEKYDGKTKFLNDYKIIVKRNGKFYVPTFCLLQFYAIRNRSEIFTSPFGTINTYLNDLPILEMEKIYKDRYPYSDFPLFGIGESPYRLQSFDRLRDRREYLSKKIHLKNNDTAFQFWTFTNWYEHPQNYETERGIDRFVYLPGKGIIGGSFDFYFYFHRKKLPIKYVDFMNNIKEEKVMISDIY